MTYDIFISLLLVKNIYGFLSMTNLCRRNKWCPVFDLRAFRWDGTCLF